MFKNTFLRKCAAGFSTLALVLGLAGSLPTTLFAASITTFSDTLTRQKASTAANHTIWFVTPTGVSAGQTIILTFSGFGSTSSIAFGDVDFAQGSSGTCSSASWTEKTLAGSASGTTWGVASTSTTVTITSGTDTITAGRCVRILIGTNATTGTTGTNQISNGSAGTATIAVSGTFGDTGTTAIPIISNDQVTVSATVNPTISFSIDNSSVGFGTLTTANGRWATSGGGAAASAGTDPTASNAGDTLTISTNAPSGYTVSYNGAVLTSGSNTIAAATISSDSDGSPGTAQFAICAKGSSGSPTIATGYDCSTTSNYNFVASTTTTLFSNTAAVSAEAAKVAYLANISATTPAGSYSTTITYIDTGNF
jgi:hypothetical protein